MQTVHRALQELSSDIEPPPRHTSFLSLQKYTFCGLPSLTTPRCNLLRLSDSKGPENVLSATFYMKINRSANSFVHFTSDYITYLGAAIISKSQSADSCGNLIKPLSHGPKEADLAELLLESFDKLGTAHTF